MQNDTDVLIVGAGPVGLTLANDLAARGVNFRIIDELPERNLRSRAHGIQSRTLEALDHLGLAEPILEAAQNPQPPFFIYSNGKQVARFDFGAYPHEPFPYQLIVWQQRIEEVLENALRERGVEVERNTSLIGFDMEDDRVLARVQRDKLRLDEIRARWIVGCDGSHSTVREGLKLDMEGETLPGQFWLGEFDVDWTRSTDAMYEWWHPEGMASAVYVDVNQKWHLVVQSELFDEDRPSLEEFRRHFAEHSGESDVRLFNPLWMDTLTINQRMPRRFLIDHAVLAGDAAHVHSAAAGQGMNTGIQDALNLGWKLALAVSGNASPGLLQTYEEERLANARRVLKTTKRFQAIQLPRGKVGRWFAGAYFRLMGSIPGFESLAARRVGMLDLNYKGRSLTKGNSTGAHVAQAPCRLEGRPTTLFDLVRDTSASVLLWTGVDPSPDQTRRLLEISSSLESFAPYVRVYAVFPSEAATARFGKDGHKGVTDGGQHLRKALGLSVPEVIFIRPDGYIGLRDTSLELREVRDYLKLIFTQTVKAPSSPSEKVKLL